MHSIAQMIQAARQHGAHRPFGEADLANHPIGIDMTTTKPQTKLQPPTRIEPEDLQICDDALPERPRVVASKYALRFEAMKMGQALEVPGPQTNHVADAMRKWIRAKGLNAHTRTMKVFPRCPKGLGRVWLMEGPQDSAIRVGQKKAQAARGGIRRAA